MKTLSFSFNEPSFESFRQKLFIKTCGNAETTNFYEQWNFFANEEKFEQTLLYFFWMHDSAPLPSLSPRSDPEK